MPDVRISVIITAHSRKIYLESALKSVINQTLDRNLYEIIVVKNFNDNYIDQIAIENKVISIFSDTEFLGLDKVLGIKASSGDILCFLDDDDQFLPKKLENVLSIFDTYPDLVFYRNNPVFFDEIGNRGQLIRGAIKLHNFVNPQYDQLKTLVEDRAAFNSSCISIKKSLVSERLDEFARIKNIVDYYLFILACNSRKRIIADTVELTRYRASGKLSTSRPSGNFVEFRTKTLRVKRSELADIETMSLADNRPEVQKIIACEIVYLRLYVNLFTDTANRKLLLLDGFRYLNCVFSMPTKYKPFFIAYSFIALLDKNLIQAIIYKSALYF
jgi:glycosyltransferase involved in cell wall biosynthesis